MADIIPFPKPGTGPVGSRPRTLEQRVSELRTQSVPPERRDAVARAVGRLATKIGPTPKRGAKRLFDAAGLEEFYGHRKRLVLLEGERSTHLRKAWAEYFRLGEAAAHLLAGGKDDAFKKLRETHLRQIIEAKPEGTAPALEQTSFDVHSLIMDCAVKICSRVRNEVPELETLYHLVAGLPPSLELSSCEIEICLGAIEWIVEIDAFYFPEQLVKGCPNILIGGNLWWSDPEECDEARNFDNWVQQFQSPICVPDQAFSIESGFGWKQTRIKVFEPLKLIVRPPTHPDIVDSSQQFQTDNWEAILRADGDILLSGLGSAAQSNYLGRLIKGEYIDHYSGDDFSLYVYDLWGSTFGVVHCVGPEYRKSHRVPEYSENMPFLLEEDDEALRRLIDSDRWQMDRQIEIGSKISKLLQTDYFSAPPKFIPNFSVDNNEPVPAHDKSFTASLLRNMRHAENGERLDDIVVAKGKFIAEQVRSQLEYVAKLVENYREGIVSD